MSRGRKSPEETLKALEEKKAQLDARIKAESAKVRAADRKKDTRRKVIAGALALEHMAIDPAFAETLKGLLSQHVKRSEDRSLFGLYPLEN